MLVKRIKQLRKKHNLSQDGLAKKANITYSTIIKIERGANENPKLETLWKLADAFEITIDELVERKFKKSTKS